MGVGTVRLRTCELCWAKLRACVHKAQGKGLQNKPLPIFFFFQCGTKQNKLRGLELVGGNFEFSIPSKTPTSYPMDKNV